MNLSMTVAEREAFLKGVHVGVIGIEQADAPPLAVPVWYDFEPGRGVWLVTGNDSLKARLLRRAGRFTLCAQSETPPAYRYVSVEGPVVDTRPAELERDRRPMAHRYLGAQLGDAYVKSQPGDGELVFSMRPERWRTIDYGKLELGS
jgi:nitroimidazol reductase NimA-like FMN-containing flavoprotein (pyridoxamine 5'-phosphate oxidase superfamily)